MLLTGLLPPTAAAQFLLRPYDDWRTLRTEHFTFHYPRDLDDWTRYVAARIESIDSAVVAVVGNAPRARVNVMVEDPYNVSNGSAIPFLRRPVITFWATPPDPREEIGELRSWGEMLSSHEFAHIAHLAWPSRNTFRRLVWQILPVDLGPIPLHAPRWVVEGYATYVEGRVTGTGRPYGTWRAALLRQWAIDGHMPTYAQLDASASFEGGSYAYLVGSAFLEWLALREGDSSLVHVWRRMTAREPRSFAQAFAGVYGEGPAELYGRFAAEVTAKALAAERAIAADSGRGGGVVQGELVQHLAWATGDPAMSPDGKRVAIVLRSPGRPSRVVVWSASPEPDTMEAKRNARLLARDPQDVPARRFYPPAKRVLAKLVARAGIAFENPRFLSDGKRVLVWRYTPRGDGTLSPDVYEWDTRNGDVRRITHGAAVREADPAPDGTSAVATRCRGGHCDVALVDLASGAVTTIAKGSPETSYYRPRFSPGGSIAVAVHHDNRWRIALLDPRTGTQRFVDPDDGASRYDAAWISPTALALVSDRGGIANIERLDVSTGTSTPLTRVRGAAVAPEANPVDGSIWFLSLHARGYDLRRLALDSTRVVGRIALDARLAPALPPASPGLTTFHATAVPESESYGLGPRSTRWLPGLSASAEGVGGTIYFGNVDPVGRLALGLALTPSTPAAWHGASFDLVWRGLPPEIEGSAFVARQRPSRAGPVLSYRRQLDAQIAGGRLGVAYSRSYDAWSHRYLIAASSGTVSPDSGAHMRRNVGFASFDGNYRQNGETWRLAEGVGARLSAGITGGAAFQRALGTVAISTGGDALWPLTASASFARLWGAPPPFERYAVGGVISSPAQDAVLDQRIDMPALPAATFVGNQVAIGRASTSILGLRPFYWIARADSASEAWSWNGNWHRVYGVDFALAVPPAPALGLPGASATLGVGRSLDAPFAHQVRAWAVIRLEP